MRRAWVRVAGAIVAIGLLALTTAALTRRWALPDASLHAHVLRSLEQASGLSMTASGPMTLRLLPRPTVEIWSVAMQGVSGAVALDADVFRGKLDLGALVGGDLRVASASFEAPTIVLDLDRLQPLLASMFERDSSAPPLALLHTGGLTLHGGVIRLLSRDHRRDTLVTDLSATAEWPSDAAEASLTGSGTWRGVTGQFGIDIDSPGRALRGGETLGSATLKSSVLDLDLQGTLSGGGDVQATGTITATTPDLQAFLRTIGMPAPQLVGVHQARLGATATVSGDTLSLDPATLGLDDMVFEGALAVHERAGRTSLAGTLATDGIDLDPFMGALPVFVSPDGDWSNVPLGTRSVAFDDIDLRISASAAHFRSFVVQDGSLSLQSGDGRMELSIGEAHAYDGLLKGRIVATLDAGATDIRAEATLSRLDAKALLKDLPGAYRASGTVTSHIALDARGTTPADLVRDVSGRGQITVRSGEIGTRLLASMIRAAPSARPALPILAGGAPFDAASIDITLDHGTASLNDSSIVWPASRAEIGGSAFLPTQDLNLRVTVSPVDAEGTAEGGAEYDLKGSWHDLLLKPVRPHS